ncbi:carbohydrate ABC transporter ATP-binding protein (CUT1 family) [Rhodovulum imhoffii]|uniref:Carbohydrate ABC transporter ATP-binding protein (CUT1 family) n=2 Tax=Rhodovulum imhoffii TaxID=365340 RepID=A0A2T5BNX0_9RHOB|nr:sn-glycerol-3-phosphate ABC transporter ATP-binding protein UgpC [Rhodovulum imhoffii]MBK5933627.1 sugar ABC transporter ATP-binding protein [Rhodovulum imhoffii]PTN00710.1 carbohydrate ABC transporter ATP-binding protein (CUT1 family) [Rhodovulum imhoffii]
MSAIILNKVVKTYGAVQVVHGIDLEIEEGEFVVLLGPSGCGKTTTLRMVAGLEDVSGGELSIGGKIVNDVAPKDRGVAMVFQNYALYPHMTVRQNMEFALRPMKLGKTEVANRIAATAGILGLGDLLERRPAQLSGGQRQRVAMGRAMVRTPEVFLFDEPLSNLDAKLRTQVRWEIGKLHQRLGTTVLYVTHDQVEAMTLADKIVIMRDGHVEQVGTPEDVYAAPKSTFVATFIGSPSMNMIAARVISGCLQADALSVPIPERFADRVSEGQAVTLGVRPIEIKRVGADTPGAMKARVEVTEYLGNEALLDLRVGQHELVAEVPADQRAEPGETVHVCLNTTAVHLFDTESGLTLAE